MNKKILLKTLLTTSTVGLLRGGIASSFVLTSCNAKTTDIIGREYSLNQLDKWNYKASKHPVENFSSLSNDDEQIINFLKSYYHPNDILNTIVKYITWFLTNTYVENSDEQEISVHDALKLNDSKLHITYIKQENLGSYQIEGLLTFYLKESIIYDEIPIPPIAYAQMYLFTTPSNNFTFSKAFFLDTGSQMTGNNLKFTGQESDIACFYTGIIAKIIDSSMVVFEKIYNNIISPPLPLVGFDDVSFPLQ